jgi:hypothetical protein
MLDLTPEQAPHAAPYFFLLDFRAVGGFSASTGRT